MRFLQELEQRIGLDLYLIADEAFFGDQGDPSTAHHGVNDQGEALFDAFTAYNMFENHLTREGETADAFMQREAMPLFRNWGAKTRFCPNVMPTYHDFRGHNSLTGTSRSFRNTIRSALALDGTPLGQDTRRLFFVTSFNEWWEGTAVEPAEEYGTDFLETIAETFP